MSVIQSHEVGSNLHMAGVDRGVFYPAVGPGVPWNGLISVVEEASDSDVKITYMDGIKVQTQLNLGTFSAQISAVTYPPEFEEYDGYDVDELATNQTRKPFNFTYRTMIGNDEKNLDYGYLIHLVYNALAKPTTREYKALNDSPDPTPFEWNISTTPVLMEGLRPTSHLVINSTKSYPAALAALEGVIYGDSLNDPRFPTMPEVMDLFESFAIFKVTDHGDGTATISGPDDAVFMTGPDTARFTWPSVVQLSDDTYRLTSL